MAVTPYSPISWSSEEAISQPKMSQMANNDQWLFENMPRIRYTGGGIIKDTSIKVLSGKFPFAASTNTNYWYLNIYFGSFFSPGCSPVVVATCESGGHGSLRANVSVQGIPVGQLGTNGFQATVFDDTHPTLSSPGWVHWIAVGW